MKFSDGIKAVKEERRSLTKRLKQIDSILAGFANLSGKTKPEKATKSAPKKVKRTRKPITKPDGFDAASA